MPPTAPMWRDAFEVRCFIRYVYFAFSHDIDRLADIAYEYSSNVKRTQQRSSNDVMTIIYDANCYYCTCYTSGGARAGGAHAAVTESDSATCATASHQLLAAQQSHVSLGAAGRGSGGQRRLLGVQIDRPSANRGTASIPP